MKRSAALGAFALLLFAACGSGGSSFSSRTKNTTPASSGVPETATGNPAVTIAAKVGCVAPKAAAVVPNMFGLPDPVASVQCTAHGVTYKVNVYATDADVQRLFNATGQKVGCTLGKVARLKAPYYSVNGDKFVVQAFNPASPPGTLSSGTLAQAKAMGIALKLPVTTVTCPA